MADCPFPTHLAAEGRRFWIDVAEEYGDDFEPYEFNLLRLACEALDRSTQARKAIRRHGLTYLSPQGSPVARPEIALEKSSRSAFAQLVRQLGLGSVEPEQEDELAPDEPARGRVRPLSRRRRVGTYAANKGAV